MVLFVSYKWDKRTNSSVNKESFTMSEYVKLNEDNFILESWLILKLLYVIYTSSPKLNLYT